MIRIKVCGITCREDAELAVACGADAVGFVFAARSKRRADPRIAAAIVPHLPPFVSAVGVFQDQPLEEVNRMVRQCRLDLAQLHGSEDEGFLSRVDCRAVKAVSLSREEDLARLASYPNQHTFLLDAFAGGQAGGTGISFDWEWARRAKGYGRIILAGGLGPHNVAEAIRRVRPWAVDAASGTEAAPGRKDPEKVRGFIRNARQAAARCETI